VTGGVLSTGSVAGAGVQAAKVSTITNAKPRHISRWKKLDFLELLINGTSCICVRNLQNTDILPYVVDNIKG
jgi:hypothetical protein